MLTAGKADAFALSRDSLPPFVAKLPGSRIVDGGFQLTGIAIAVPKGRPQALAYCHGVPGKGEELRRGAAARSTAPGCRICRWRRSAITFRPAGGGALAKQTGWRSQQRRCILRAAP